MSTFTANYLSVSMGRITDKWSWDDNKGIINAADKSYIGGGRLITFAVIFSGVRKQIDVPFAGLDDDNMWLLPPAVLPSVNSDGFLLFDVVGPCKERELRAGIKTLLGDGRQPEDILKIDEFNDAIWLSTGEPRRMMQDDRWECTLGDGGEVRVEEGVDYANALVVSYMIARDVEIDITKGASTWAFDDESNPWDDESEFCGVKKVTSADERKRLEKRRSP